MRRKILAVATLLLLGGAAALWADTFAVMKLSMGGGNSFVNKSYQQGMNFRIETLGPDGSSRVVIRNTEKSFTLQVDPKTKTYSELSSSPDILLTLAGWIAHRPATHETGKRVDVYYETVDTGERKEFFGRTGRHLIVRERRVAESGACYGSYQAERDGWYVPRSDPAPATGVTAVSSGFVIGGSSVAHLSGAVAPFGGIQQGLGCHDKVVEHGDHSNPGIAVIETFGEMRREVLELSNAPLDKGLFEIPAGYKNVTQPRDLAMEWKQLEWAFRSWWN